MVLNLATNQFGEAFEQVLGSDHQLSISGRSYVTGQYVKQGCNIAAQFRVAAKNTQVFINPGSAWVIVARSSMDIAPNAILFFADDKG